MKYYYAWPYCILKNKNQTSATSYYFTDCLDRCICGLLSNYSENFKSVLADPPGWFIKYI